jgi:hypothetical protein
MNHLAAYVAAVAVLLGFITAVLGLVNQRRANTATGLAAKAARLAEETAGTVQSISVQVDGRLSALFERQAQLLDALYKSGTPVPAPLPAPPQTPAGNPPETPPETPPGGPQGSAAAPDGPRT